MSPKRFLCAGIIALVVLSALFFVVFTASPAKAGTVELNSLRVTWDWKERGISCQVVDIKIANLANFERTINLGGVIKNANFPLSQLRDINFYVWAGVNKEVNIVDWADVAHDATIYNVTYFNRIFTEPARVDVGDLDSNIWVEYITTENSDVLIGGFDSFDNLGGYPADYLIHYSVYEAIGEHVENKNIAVWKRITPQMVKLYADRHDTDLGVLVIPPAGSPVIRDDYGEPIRGKGTIGFRFEFTAPVVKTATGWGSSGRLGMSLDNVFYGSGYVGEPGSSWWDSDYSYRKEIELGTHPENYQIMIELDRNTDLADHCLENFDDIRFLENWDGSELYYWGENIISGDNATFWVRRITNDASDNTIFIYYGNSASPNNENGDDVFILYDHFDGDNLDPTKWGAVAPSNGIGVESSLLTINGSSEDWEAIVSRATFLDNTIFRASAKLIGKNVVFGFASSQEGNLPAAWWNDSDPEGTHRAKSGTAATQITAVTEASNLWYIYEVHHPSKPQVFFLGKENVATHYTQEVIATMPLYFSVYGNVQFLYVDWALVRKYTATEPTVILGAEEAGNIRPNQPTALSPTARQIVTAVSISCTVTDNDGNPMTVYFYDNADDSEIGHDNAVASGGTAAVTWEILTRGTTYTFYAGAIDNENDAGDNSTAVSFMINTAPTAEIITPADGYDGEPDEEISFTSNAADGDGDALTYSWDLGDFNTSDNENLTHAYSAGGYTITLKVDDGFENSATDSIIVNVGTVSDGGNGGGGGGGGGGGFIETIPETVDAIVLPHQNVLFRTVVGIGSVLIPLWVLIALVGAMFYAGKQHYLAYSIWAVGISLIYFGGRF